MTVPLEQHQTEIQSNRLAWERKPLLREIYAGFYQRILDRIDRSLSGPVVEIGSGIGNLRTHLPGAICSDLFPNRWLDLVCDGYELPFAAQSLSHLVLFDVFHHLERPAAFLREASRVVRPGGRLIVFEPYISLASAPVYGLGHHEPIAWRRPIDLQENAPRPRDYYAAQGNATRVFFGANLPAAFAPWRMVEAGRFASFSYLFSGGFSRRALYPATSRPVFERLDAILSRWPRLFGGRCLVVLQNGG